MQHQLQQDYQLHSQKEAFAFLRRVLKSSYPIAIWRLPRSPSVHALIDITSDEQQRSREIERLNQSFIINGYDDTHPTSPLVLNGDILIKVDTHGVSVKTNPTLGADILEEFNAVVSSDELPLKTLTNQQPTDYPQIVKLGIEAIQSGGLHKVVLSRFSDFNLDPKFDLLSRFQKLCESYENAFCHLTNTQTYGCWMGASPEKLIAIADDQYFSTDALAGTQPLKDGTALIEVGWTQKEIEEQAMVSRYIIDCFKKIRLRVYEEEGPKTVKAGNLTHLKTTFKVDMQATNSAMLGSTMLELLHPTSAVCGMPRESANQFIALHEGYDRSLYAGFLGPVGFNGNTDLFVNLRCMQVDAHKARLFAGAGITGYSNPEKEFEETRFKMQTMLKVLTA